MYRQIFAAISILLVTGHALGMSQATESFFQGLKSSVLEVIDAHHPFYNESLGEYPFYARIVQQEIFKANPIGKPVPTKPECQFKAWQTQVLQAEPPLSFADFSSTSEKLLTSCEKEFQTGPTDILSNTIFAMNLQLDVKNHPFAQHVIINLPSGIKLKGLLALKPDHKKRPLVIFRTGIFSNTQEFYPERFLFMMGFEQAPFNMLVIESLSGSEFVKHNNSFSMGGFDEGMQNYWIARELQNPEQPIAKYISEVHLLGMSMGGQGVFFATLLNDLNPGNFVKSSMTLCPLLNTQETLDFHQTQGFTMYLMNTWASKRLEVLRERNPKLGVSTFIEDGFEDLKRNYHRSMLGPSANIKLPVGMDHELQGKKAPGLYWKLNNFWPYYKNIKTPMFVLATKHDPIVSWFINAGRLLDGRLDLAGSNVKLFPFSEGYHCSLSVAYDWEKLATFLQTYYLKYSDEYRFETYKVRKPLSRSVIEYYGKEKSEQVMDLTFEIPPGESAAQVEVQFFKKQKPNFFQRLFSPKMEVSLPLSEMEFPRQGVVVSKAEQSLLRRWAYQNIQVHIEGDDLVFTWPRTKE